MHISLFLAKLYAPSYTDNETENANDLHQSSIHNVVLNNIATQLKSFEYLIGDLKKKKNKVKGIYANLNDGNDLI